ncbi:MAG: LTA synthase family protein, partial [Clostridia bacterium]|nr:LTA synthase family protein [Clostridia bacterium]
IGLVTLLAVVIFSNQFTSQEFSKKWLLLAFALICPFILGLSAAYKINIKNQLADKIWHFAFLLLLPIITITMTECLNSVFIYDMTYLGFWGNYAVILVMYFIFFALTGSFRLSYVIVTPILYGFALAHSYVMEFRGTPFLPMDFLSITTAVGVANTNNYLPTYKIIVASLIFIFIMIIGIKTKTPKYNLTVKIISRTFLGTFSAILLILFYATNVFANMGIKPDFWNQTRGYHNYGFVWNFFCNTKYLYMSEPNDYNSEAVGDYLGNVGSSDDEQIDNSYKKPNIICIMNESLSDLSVLGNLTTNEDYMPFMRSLTENTIKGNLYVPVIGAGTSNTEFEFLTGHTTAFLPSGSNAYMLYIKNPIASLVSTLEAQGYSSYALHPYYAEGWKRTEVYSNLGFNKFISLENIMDISLMEKYKESGNDANYLQSLVEQMYPGKNMLLRQYINDDYNYKLLIEDFENRDKSVPYYAFNVTMQNHGGYTTSCINFNESIFATSTTKAYNKANKYLSLVKASDDAFKELIEYFSKVKEPTVICMFGDHQPSIETSFISEVMGVSNLSNLTVEQEQSRHATPFFIWANYDIEEKYIDKLSSNYLSSLVLQTAGVKLTEYNKYLLKMSETLPVIDTVGYIDNQNNYYKWSDVSPYTSLLDDYEKVQYNNIFDQQNVNSEIFYLGDYKPEATPIEKDD